MVSGLVPGRAWMGLRDALEVLVGSEPFERLLLERQRPIVARAEAGEDFVVAGVATALEAPLLAVAPGPREAEALAADLEAFLGPERVALLPAWEALPYEGISPAPEIAARRAGTVARMREAKGAFVLVAPVLAAMQGLIPTLGVTPRCSSWQGSTCRPTRSRSASSTSATRGRTSSSTGRVRRAGWRGRRVPGHRAPAGPRRLLG